MADKKISQLVAAGALDGTELLPVVQGGVTKRTTVADMAAQAVGGVLSGSLPNPSFAVDMATQAELDAVGAAAVLDGDAAGGVLAGTYPSPSFAVNMATQAELDAVAAAPPNAHASTHQAGAADPLTGSYTVSRLGLGGATAWSTVEKLRVVTPTTADTVANVMISADAVTSRPLTIQNIAGQTSTVLDFQNSAGTSLAQVNSTGSMRAASFGSGSLNKALLTPNADTGGFILSTGADANKGLVVKGNSGTQSANIQEWQDSAGAVMGSVSATGVLCVNSTGAAGTVEKFRVNPPTTVDNLANTILSASATTSKPLVVQAKASQTANLQEWQSSAGGVIAKVSSTGAFTTTTQLYVDDLRSVGGTTFINTAMSMAAGYLFTSNTGGILNNGVLDQRGIIKNGGGPVTINPNTSGTKGLLIQGLASQSANLQEWQNSAGTVLASVVAAGDFTLPRAGLGGATAWSTVEKLRVVTPTTPDTSANVMFAASTTTAKPLVVQGIASQSANLQDWQNSAGTVLASMSAIGDLTTHAFILSGAGGPSAEPAFRASTGCRIFSNVVGSWSFGDTSGGTPLIMKSVGTNSAFYSGLDIVSNSTGGNGLLISGVPTGHYISLGGLGYFDNKVGLVQALQATTTVGHIIKGAASQTADLAKYQTSAAADVLTIGAAGLLTFGDGVNVVTNATTGTKFGTATSQKMSWWNKTPVIQPASASQAAVDTTAATNAAPYGFTTAAQADGIVTLLNQIRSDLVAVGILKGSA